MPAVWQEQAEEIEAAEMHWSVGTILTVFFAVTFVSAVFFGLGYSFGRGAPALSHWMPAAATSPTADAAGEKAVSSTAPAAATATEPAAMNAAAPAPSKATSGAKKTSPQVPAAAAADAPFASDHPAVRLMVQVGAIGSKKDAQRLVAQLRRRGFHAGIYKDAKDRFLHVQIGPFPDAAQADAMRRRVQASGFHAILKHQSRS